MKTIMTISLALLLFVSGLYAAAQAETEPAVYTEPTALMAQNMEVANNLAEYAELMNVLQQVNLRQIDRASKKAFETFFEQKEQMIDQIDHKNLLEKPAIGRAKQPTRKAPARANRIR